MPPERPASHTGGTDPTTSGPAPDLNAATDPTLDPGPTSSPTPSPTPAPDLSPGLELDLNLELDPAPQLPSPLVELTDDRLARHGLRLLLKRDDLIHPALSGNKFRKLLPNLTAAARAGHRTLLTFGGAWSNHLHATATAGHLLGFHTIGIVRGDELAHRPLNPLLAEAAAHGMCLHFVDRTTYRRKTEPAVLAALIDRHGPAYVLPEGGSNALAARGCAALGREIGADADVVAVACGTGGTLAGLAAGLPDTAQAIGFAALRGDFLSAEVTRLQHAAFGGPRGDWRIENRFHHGGYARRTPALDAFATDFAARHGLAPDPTYVAKMLYGLYALADARAFPPGTRIAAVITGASAEPTKSSTHAIPREPTTPPEPSDRSEHPDTPGHPPTPPESRLRPPHQPPVIW